MCYFILASPLSLLRQMNVQAAQTAESSSCLTAVETLITGVCTRMFLWSHKSVVIRYDRNNNLIKVPEIR